MSTEAATVGGKLFHWRPRVERFRRRAVRRLVVKGYAPVDAEEMVGKIGDGKILDWIIEHGDEIMAVIKFIVMLLGLFAMAPSEEDEAALDTL